MSVPTTEHPAHSAPIPHAQRHHTTHPDTVYILPADEDERTRLNSQHTSLTQALSSLLLAPLTLQPKDKVLDIGTGTGIWLLELAEQFPGIEGTGIDISDTLFPPNPPKGLTFEIQSALSLDSNCAFRLIHQRLLISSLTRAQWPTLLQKLYDALQPGGWIQLVEPGPCTAGPRTEHWKSLLSQLCAKRGIWEDIPTHLPSLLQSLNFTQIAVTEKLVPMDLGAGDEGAKVRKDHVSFVRGCMGAILDSGGFGVVGSVAEFEELVRDVEREAEEVGSGVRWVAVCARKPEEGEVRTA